MNYSINNLKITGWILCAISGFIDGVLEGYGFDGRTSFERKWGIDKASYFGSESWRMVYNGGDPEQGFKSIFHKLLGAFDFYHHADDVRKAGYIGGGLLVGVGGSQYKKTWYYIIDFGIAFIISAIAKSAGMYWVRN